MSHHGPITRLHAGSEKFENILLALLNLKSNAVYDLHRIPLTRVNCINKKKEQRDKLLVTEARRGRKCFRKPGVSKDARLPQRMLSPRY